MVKKFNEKMPEEMKLVLLADFFNTIAHNLQLIFGDKSGKQFFYGRWSKNIRRRYHP